MNRQRTLVGHEQRPRHDVHDHNEEEERHEQDPSFGLAISARNNPEANLLSAMNLVAWLDMLPTADREMLRMRHEGHDLDDVRKAMSRSVAGASRRAQQLGFELAERAGVNLAPRTGGRRGRSVQVR